MLVCSQSKNQLVLSQDPAKKCLTKSILKNSSCAQNISPKIIAIRSKLLHEPSSPSVYETKSVNSFMNNIIAEQASNIRSRSDRTEEIDNQNQRLFKNTPNRHTNLASSNRFLLLKTNVCKKN